ncbi:Inositol-pentakisphosphate 2-kinase [Taenia solium]|eukprot:TsM_001094500 transcript=TsM_001094500 gene=TsM_001094500
MIYRIRKSSMPALLSTKKTRASKKSRQLAVLFGQHRMAQYFGSNFIHPFKLIDVDPSILRAINDRFQSSRPVFRLDRGVDLQTTRVLTAPDATCIPADLTPYGEGSPKFGAIPRGPERDPVEATVRRNAMFCIMQYDETKRRMWGRPSSYCPCDLFSGNQERMLRALFAMLEVRQNNLRVFRDSCCVLNNSIDLLDSALMDFFHPSLRGCESEGTNYSSSGDSTEVAPSHASRESSSDGQCDGETACHSRACQLHPAGKGSLCHRFLEGLLLPALLTEIPPSTASGGIRRSPDFRYECDLHPYTPSTSSNGYRGECYFIVEKNISSPVASISTPGFRDLPQNSPLGRILQAQMESSLSHQDLIKHYKSVAAYFEEHNISWDSYISGKVVVNTAEAPPCLTESLNLVEKHLVAMVARDCSIMLTFQRAKNNCLASVLTVGGECPCIPRTIINITIVDLDPKELSNLQERVESERCVVEQFLFRREG